MYVQGYFIRYLVPYMYPLQDKFRFVQLVPRSYSEIFLVSPLLSKLYFNFLPIFPFVNAFPVKIVCRVLRCIL